ncbi:methanethiol S-methyltransferase [Fodinibius sediminis]|uniref:methanethiol S-methyltransferase n=1 Tax=Fodinibius sediminis TaxID=1214077 RepID=A0A521DLZ5_9BACT|nr:methanethiol S-methyltransferase [Fodinibius sediminis]SMO72612.1 Protein-S-isoprenylcysteine O-methyltransferase Ste14 [Fodinibius sediminis]
MKRILAFIYGILSYVIFLASFCYAIAFVGDFWVPKTINSGATSALVPALLVNMALLGAFAIQHSGMARRGFKRWWTNIIPKPIERSTYVLISSMILILLMWFWQPIPATVWSVESELGRWLLWGVAALGWLIVLVTTYLISHAHLFGLQQVYDFLQARDLWYPRFQTPGLYRYIRHPMMLGFFLAFWATPEMTGGHLLFAVATSGYILVALRFEEQDLIRVFGDQYRKYRKRVPMLLPGIKGRKAVSKNRNVKVPSE